jgi:hypothetical protein
MSNTNTQTEASAVKVTRKHTAKKLENDIYQYRGWIIKKYDNNYLNDDEIKGFQWNTYRNMDEYKASRSIDIASTLRDAKMYIDICVERDLESIDSKQKVATKASKVKVSRKNGMRITRFNFGAVEARQFFPKDSVVDVSASGDILGKYQEGVDAFIEIGSDGYGSWEISSRNDDGYGSGALIVEGNIVVDSDGAFDLPGRIKEMLKNLGYTIGW